VKSNEDLFDHRVQKLPVLLDVTNDENSHPHIKREPSRMEMTVTVHTPKIKSIRERLVIIPSYTFKELVDDICPKGPKPGKRLMLRSHGGKEYPPSQRIMDAIREVHVELFLESVDNPLEFDDLF